MYSWRSRRRSCLFQFVFLDEICGVCIGRWWVMGVCERENESSRLLNKDADDDAWARACLLVCTKKKHISPFGRETIQRNGVTHQTKLLPSHFHSHEHEHRLRPAEFIFIKLIFRFISSGAKSIYSLLGKYDNLDEMPCRYRSNEDWFSKIVLFHGRKNIATIQRCAVVPCHSCCDWSGSSHGIELDEKLNFHGMQTIWPGFAVYIESESITLDPSTFDFRNSWEGEIKSRPTLASQWKKKVDKSTVENGAQFNCLQMENRLVATFAAKNECCWQWNVAGAKNTRFDLLLFARRVPCAAKEHFLFEHFRLFYSHNCLCSRGGRRLTMEWWTKTIHGRVI